MLAPNSRVLLGQGGTWKGFLQCEWESWRWRAQYRGFQHKCISLFRIFVYFTMNMYFSCHTFLEHMVLENLSDTVRNF